MKVCILSGSPRKLSNSLRFSKALANSFQKNGNISSIIVDFSKNDIPLLSAGEIDKNRLTVFQQNLLEAMSSAEIVVIVSPEYNWMPSAELINFLNCMTSNDFRTMWHNKIFAICGVSNGRGGRLPCIQLTNVLNKILGFMNYSGFVAPRSFESHFTPEYITEDGFVLENSKFENNLNQFVIYIIALTKKWNFNHE